MGTLFSVGLGFAGAGALAFVMAGLLWWSGNKALDRQVVHDGIGGKLTDNFLGGCFSVLASLALGIGGVVFLLIGGGFMLAAWLS